MTPAFDLLVIGGGINGCGIARDAAGRGFSVCLAEMDDLASGTSSWSTKLIHGGLRYLEHYHFRLVREALLERERLLAMAPHLIRPIRFVLPHAGGMRPAWLLRLGLLLYDHLGGREHLPASRKIDLRRHPAGRSLKPGFAAGFVYSDCTVDDCRLVVLNARDAATRGASIRTRCKVESAAFADGAWTVGLRDACSGASDSVRARMLVSAAGPWAETVARGVIGDRAGPRTRLVQGSHIVVPRLYDHDYAFTFQGSDGRVVFVIPYETDFTLIGTTDNDFAGDPADVAITAGEQGYLCAAASAYLGAAVTPDRIVWSFSGVRPLQDDGATRAQEATRDYVLRMQGADGAAPLLTVIGGKLTTYRRLAEAALERIEACLGRRAPAWTATAPLPGGGFPIDGLPDLEGAIAARAPDLPAATVRRLARAYGTDAMLIVGDGSASARGRHLGAGLYESEVDWLLANEFARTADDILWRRGKLGLIIDAAGRAALVSRLQSSPHPVAGVARA